MKKKDILIVLVLLMMPFLAGAQALKGSYFLDSSLNRHEMNPAFAPRANYVQLFGIGNFGVGEMTNLDMPSLLYPVNGKLATFLHPDVSVKQFDRTFPKHPHFDVNFDATLLGFGFYTKRKSFWTFDVDMRANVDADLPGDLFRFIKMGAGTSGKSFNVGNVNVYGTSGIQASLGYSRNIVKGLRVGVKARVIAPMCYGAINLENVRLTTGADKWTLSTEGYAHLSAQGLTAKLPEGEMVPEFSFDQQLMLQNKVLAGFGYSFDLGFEYRLENGSLLDGLAVSAAVTDLGKIRYKQNATHSYSTKGSVDWVGFQNVSMDNMEFESVLNDFIEEAKNSLVNLSEIKHDGEMTRSTMPRIYAGVEIPLCTPKVTVGMLYSSRISHSYARNELTTSLNLNPCKWFALGLNYSFLNTTRSMGFIMEFTPKIGPTLYIGADYLPVEFAPLGMDIDALNSMITHLPTSWRMNLNFGLALHTGSKHLKKNTKPKR